MKKYQKIVKPVCLTERVCNYNISIKMGEEYAQCIFYVVSYSQISQSLRSNEITTVLSEVPDKPTRTSVRLNDSRVLISWHPPRSNGSSEILGFIISRTCYNDTERSYTEFTVGKEVNSYVDDTIEYGNEYYYQIFAYNVHGRSKSENSHRIFPVDYPGKPMNFYVKNTNYGILITWDPPVENGGVELVYYILYKSKEGGFSEIILIEIENNSYLDLDVVQGCNYSYKMSSSNGIKKSEYTEEKKLTHTFEYSENEEISWIIKVMIIILLNFLASFLVISILLIVYKKRRNLGLKESIVEILENLTGKEKYEKVEVKIQNERSPPPEFVRKGHL